jgi:glycosyltransferase involved in cell wall biosynthesis
MTIGIFIDDRYPISGGSTRSVQLQVTALQKLGHKVVVIGPQTSDDLPYVYKVSCPKLPWLPEGSLKSSLKIAKTIVERYKFDIVHSQTERGALLLARKVAQLSGAHHVHTFHGHYGFLIPYYPIAARALILANNFFVKYLLGAPKVDMPASLDGFYTPKQKLEKIYLRSLAMTANMVDRYITPMPYIRDGIQKVAPTAHGNVIPTGIDPAVFGNVERVRPFEPPFEIVHMGRIVKEKRAQTTMQAFLLAAKQVPDIELTVIGPGDQRQKLQAMANATPYANRVHIVGPIFDRQKLAQELADSDAFITASYRFETQGMVLLEAAAAGLALVYCDDLITVGVDPTNSVLTKPDAQSLANGLIKLANNREATKQMGQASRQIALRLSMDEIEKRIVEIYQELAKK